MSRSALKSLDPQLADLLEKAHDYSKSDPAVALIKLRTFGERAAQLVAQRAGIDRLPNEPQFDLLNRLQEQRAMPKRIADAFHTLRMAGNAATHENSGSKEGASDSLAACDLICDWVLANFSSGAGSTGNKALALLAPIALGAFAAVTTAYLAPRFLEKDLIWTLAGSLWVVCYAITILTNVVLALRRRGARRLASMLLIALPAMVAWILHSGWVTLHEYLGMALLLVFPVGEVAIRVISLIRSRSSKNKKDA